MEEEVADGASGERQNLDVRAGEPPDAQGLVDNRALGSLAQSPFAMVSLSLWAAGWGAASMGALALAQAGLAPTQRPYRALPPQMACERPKPSDAAGGTRPRRGLGCGSAQGRAVLATRVSTSYRRTGSSCWLVTSASQRTSP